MSPRVAVHHDLRPAYRAARRAGWTFEWTGSGHHKWIAPGGGFVIVSGTPNGGRHVKENTISRLRKLGLSI